MAHYPRLVNLMTHLTIFWEVFYCALIWPRALRPIEDFARERLIREQETLRETEQGSPQLVLDLRAATRVLDVLPNECAPLVASLRIDVEHRPQPMRRPVGRRARGALELGDDIRMNGERVRARQRGQPAPGGLHVGERILA